MDSERDARVTNPLLFLDKILHSVDEGYCVDVVFFTYRKLVQETCTTFLYKKLASNFWCKFLVQEHQIERVLFHASFLNKLTCTSFLYVCHPHQISLRPLSRSLTRDC